MRYCYYCKKPMYASNESIWIGKKNFDCHLTCKKNNSPQTKPDRVKSDNGRQSPAQKIMNGCKTSDYWDIVCEKGELCPHCQRLVEGYEMGLESELEFLNNLIENRLAVFQNRIKFIENELKILEGKT